MKKTDVQNDIIGQFTIKGRQMAQIFNTKSKRGDALEREIEYHLEQRQHLFSRAQALYYGLGGIRLPKWLMTRGMRQNEAQEIENIRDGLNRAHRATYYQMLGEMRRLFLVREAEVHNIIVTVGRSVLAQRLANTTTYTGIINYGALGSSATAVANGDTQLGTEVFRKVTASDSYNENIAFIDFFYSKADTNGTYQEFGTFIDGTGTANSGKLFTHALTGGWVKTASESMTVAAQYTIT